MRKTSLILIIPVLLIASFASADEFWRPGFIGNWNNIANWNNAIPAPGADTNARARDGGTINVNSIVDTTGAINLRLSDTLNDPLVTMNWNPGNGSTAQFIDQLVLSDNNDTGNGGYTGPATSVFNQQSGTLRVENNWLHVARRGLATVNLSGSAVLRTDQRVSIAEGANNHPTVGVINLSGNSQLLSTSGNESFLATSATSDAFLTLNDNAYAESRHWRVGRNAAAQATVVLNDSSTLRTGQGDGQLSLGQNGQATLIMNDTSTLQLNNNTSLRIGDNDNSVGYMEMNGSSRAVGIGNGNAHVVVGDGNLTTGTLVMNNNSAIDDMRRMWIGNGGTANGTVIMNGTSNITMNREQQRLLIAASGTADGTLIMNGDSTINIRHLTADAEQNSGGVATIVQNNNATMFTSGWTELGGGNNDTSTWTLNDDSRVIHSGAFGSSHIGIRGNGTGILTMNGNSVWEGNQSGGEFRIASQDGGATGIVNVNDNATLLAHNNITIAVNNGSTGTLNQNGGTVQVDNTLLIGGGTGVGTYNLTGGTLRTDRIDIRTTGNFDWGAGTLTMREPNRGSNGNGIEIEVVGGNNNLTTSAGSILDLGDVYTSNGNNWDTLDMNGGTLDLSAAGDTLEIWRYVSSFRPGGSNTSQTYEIKLINGNITGEFDTLSGPGPDFQYFGVYSSAQVASLGLTPANVPRNRGFIDYRVDGAYFVFNVAGQVPEPSTGLFLLFGTLMLRGVSVVRRNQRIRKSYSA